MMVLRCYGGDDNRQCDLPQDLNEGVKNKNGNYNEYEWEREEDHIWQVYKPDRNEKDMTRG